MGNVLRHDAERLRVLLERHLLYTGSARAAALLDDWQNAVTRFVKVMPKDYRRALQDIEAEQQIGRASCRERVCQYVWTSVVAGSIKKKTKIMKRSSVEK